ncbi:MAG: hypothetical protein GTO63_20395 [Anaerolineae bacterium]|nr:hypothetical protein [Anaerolineae bacterium]NIN97134.1 hypothetical protein [Anaerolineae bacterium]NIQ80107.1 hypothetical protein [Anaerolineae bacterium]
MGVRKGETQPGDEAGQSLVEFALVTLFIIIPVIVGIVDGSILFYKWVVVHNAAREGARAGAIYHYIGTAPAVGTKDQVHTLDDAREAVIKAAVDETIGPLVSIEWGEVGDWVSYDHDGKEYRCIVFRTKTDCEIDGWDVYRNGGLVIVELTHTHVPVLGLVIGVDRIDLKATAKMRIEPGLPMPLS